VRLQTHDVDGLTERDVELLGRSRLRRGIRVSPPTRPPYRRSRSRSTRSSAPRCSRFWRAVLGYREMGSEDLVDPYSRGPSFWFQEMDAARPQRNRIHIDISVPHDQAEARIAAAIAAGGHLVTDQNAPAWWVLADAEGQRGLRGHLDGPRLSVSSPATVSLSQVPERFLGRACATVVQRSPSSTRCRSPRGCSCRAGGCTPRIGRGTIARWQRSTVHIGGRRVITTTATTTRSAVRVSRSPTSPA